MVTHRDEERNRPLRSEMAGFHDGKMKFQKGEDSLLKQLWRISCQQIHHWNGQELLTYVFIINILIRFFGISLGRRRARENIPSSVADKVIVSCDCHVMHSGDVTERHHVTITWGVHCSGRYDGKCPVMQSAHPVSWRIILSFRVCFLKWILWPSTWAVSTLE